MVDEAVGLHKVLRNILVVVVVHVDGLVVEGAAVEAGHHGGGVHDELDVGLLQALLVLCGADGPCAGAAVGP